MTSIILPPDLESLLADEARRRGTTPELLALNGLRHLFGPPTLQEKANGRGTLFDFLAGYIGVIEGSTEPFSEDTSRRFSDLLAEKLERKRQ